MSVEKKEYIQLLDRLEVSEDGLCQEAYQAIQNLLHDNNLLNESYERMTDEIMRLNAKNDRLLTEIEKYQK